MKSSSCTPPINYAPGDAEAVEQYIAEMLAIADEVDPHEGDQIRQVIERLRIHMELRGRDHGLFVSDDGNLAVREPN